MNNEQKNGVTDVKDINRLISSFLDDKSASDMSQLNKLTNSDLKDEMKKRKLADAAKIKYVKSYIINHTSFNDKNIKQGIDIDIDKISESNKDYPFISIVFRVKDIYGGEEAPDRYHHFEDYDSPYIKCLEDFGIEISGDSEVNINNWFEQFILYLNVLYPNYNFSSSITDIEDMDGYIPVYIALHDVIATKK